MTLKYGYIIALLMPSLLCLGQREQKVAQQSVYAQLQRNPMDDSIVIFYKDKSNAVRKSDPELAHIYIDSIALFTNAENQSYLLSELFQQRGHLYVESGNYPGAITEFQKSINLFNEVPSLKHRSGYLQIQTGVIFYRLKQYDEAIKLYTQAIPLFDNTSEHHQSFGKALAYNNIGLCYLEMADYTTAIDNYSKALKLRLNLNDPSLIAHSYTYLSEAYRKSGDYEKADSIIELGFELKNLPPQNIWYQKLQLEKGALFLEQGNKAEARRLLESTADNVYTQQITDLYTPLGGQLAKLELAEKNYDKAMAYADKAYDVAVANKMYFEAIDFATISKNIAIAQNNPTKALHYSNKISEQKDAFLKINNKVLKDLLALSIEMNQMENHNNELNQTNSSYSDTIESQKGLLAASIVLIILLILVTVVFINLNNKLKENQRNQRELNLRILAVINRTESLILSLGPDATIRVINKPAMRFFLKWIKVELKAGDNILEKLRGSIAFSNWKNSIAKSKTVHQWKEVSQFDLQNKKAYFLENFSTITHQNGEYTGLVMVSNDITREHEFNIQMSQQNDSLEKSNKAKERMLSILAHDLKDAVYSAHSLSELVIDTPEEFPKEELLHLFELLHGNFEKTKSLLDGLLDWMRTQTGALEVKPKSFILSKLVSEVFEGLYNRSVTKGISMNMDIDDELVVHADCEMIKTVIRNLVGNAIKYTEPNKGIIIVSAKKEDDNIIIHVKDNGQGISEDNQGKLFQGPGKFSTVGTAKEKGTGFGLSLCKELVNLHKSELHLNSQIGVGTDFFFSLPVGDIKDVSKKAVH